MSFHTHLPPKQADIRALRRQIAAQIEADLARIDRCLAALDLMDGDPDIEQDAGEMPEGANGPHPDSTDDDEPSLGATEPGPRQFLTRWGFTSTSDLEEDAADLESKTAPERAGGGFVQ